MIAKAKKNKREVLKSVFFGVFLVMLALGFIAFFVISDFRITQRRKEMLGQIGVLQQEIRAIQEKNAKLAEGISQGQQDAFWEEKLREQGYKKPGEEQVVVLPPQESTSTQTNGQKNFWQKVLNIFK